MIKHLISIALLSVAVVEGCVSSADCNWAGNCVEGACQCVKGFKGTGCAELNLGVSWRCGAGGLCMKGEFHAHNTWGGGVVRGSDGKYHMYATMMSLECDLNAFFTNSELVHAVSPTPQGPYTPHDMSLTATPAPSSTWDGLIQGNPNIVTAPDGTYLLYYLGSTALSSAPVNCSAGKVPSNPGVSVCTSNTTLPYHAVCRQKIGLAYSSSPSGPWTRPDVPILTAGDNGAWDDLFVTNPAVHVFKNNSALLIYKARSSEHVGAMYTGVAYAEHWKGPYTRQAPSVPIKVPTDCEDAGIYYSEDMGVFRMLMHCSCNYMYLWSKEGTTWTSATTPNPWCDVHFTDNTTEVFSRRERPQWVLDANGTPTHISTAVQGTADPDNKQWTMLTELV